MPNEEISAWMREWILQISGFFSFIYYESSLSCKFYDYGATLLLVLTRADLWRYNIADVSLRRKEVRPNPGCFCPVPTGETLCGLPSQDQASQPARLESGVRLRGLIGKIYPACTFLNVSSSQRVSWGKWQGWLEYRTGAHASDQPSVESGWFPAIDWAEIFIVCSNVIKESSDGAN